MSKSVLLIPRIKLLCASWTLDPYKIKNISQSPLPSTVDVQNQTRAIVCTSESFLWLTVFDTVQI